MHQTIDSHLHLWDPNLLDYPWLPDDLRTRFGPEKLRDAAEGTEVSRIVVEAAAAPEHRLAEVDWIATLAAEASVVGIVAHAPLDDGDDVRPVIDTLRERPLVVGIRRLLQSEPPGFSLAPEFLRGLRAVADADLVFDACVTPRQLADVGRIADAVPDLRIVLDHLGKPDVGTPERPNDPTRSAWIEDLTALAQRPNIVCKVSGLPAQAPGGWTTDLLTPYLDIALDRFGTDRLLFGTDWPVSQPMAPWHDLVDTWAHERAGDGGAARIMGENARRIYHLA